MHSALGPGHVLAGRYQLLDQVGRGAMGIVWRGRDDLLDRDVAIKQIVLAPMSSATEAQASYQRTLREARTAARLSHAGVVTVFDVVEEDGSPWIVMELVRARPLDQVVAEDGPLPPAQAAQLGLSLLDALATAHAAGVLHRDVKPSNVLIRPDGKAVLTDFGIATIQGDPGLTQAGMVVGTPGFAPPERVRGATATPASDLWSLGATLYAAVEGRGPFDRAGGSAAIVASIATEPAPRAPSAGPLAPVIDALLRADPAMRPDAAATARMLADAWSAARRSSLAAGLRMGSAQPDGELPSAAAGHAGLDATTATQVVSVPQAVVVAALQPGSNGAAAAASSERAAATANPGSLASAEAGTDAAAAPAAARAAADPAAAISVLPDLMATPVFAELTMPAPEASGGQLRTANQLGPAGPLDQAGGPGPLASPDGPPDPAKRSKVADLMHSRRGIWLLTPVAVAAVVAGLILAFPNIGSSFVQGLSRLNPSGPSSNPAAAAKADGANLGGSRSAGGHSGRTGSSSRPPHGKNAPSGKPSGQPKPSGRPSHPGKPSPSGKPTPSGSPTGSPSPTPTPSPSSTKPSSGGTPQPPTGFGYQSVSASTAGTTAGFQVAVPTAWLLIPGLSSTFEPMAGAARLVVNMAPFTAPGPVKEARHLQAAAIAHHRYHLYHLVSILAVGYHGRPAATWTFWYRPRASIHDINVSELIYIAHTSAGPQPYVLAISAPGPRTVWAGHVFSVALRTFRPLP
jgi:serine/threonine protein kinase